jgi:hypothetical protein
MEVMSMTNEVKGDMHENVDPLCGIKLVNDMPDQGSVQIEPVDVLIMDQTDVALEAESVADHADRADKNEATTSVKPTATTKPIEREKPKILYCIPANLLDISSGAALSQRTLMVALAQKGFQAIALQATVFDSVHGGEHIMKAVEVAKDKPVFRTNSKGVEHIIVRTKGTRRGEMNCSEQEIYLKRFRAELKQRKPDMVFMWGGMLLEMTMMREAREAGVPVIFYLVNGGYKNIETFKFVSQVVTDTEATAKLYKERLGLDCKVVGKFIDPEQVKSKAERRPDFITFINPSFEKGVSVFMPLAKLAAKECPEIKFLVVQSRGRWATALHQFKFKHVEFPNVKVIGHQTDMRPIYASTRALLLPSLWHESGARVIAEAQLNGIPILASNTGGSAELVGQGGRIFELPDLVKEKKTEVLVTEEDLRPWLEEIKRQWTDQDYYSELCAKVDQEAVQHDIMRNADRFLKAVGPAVLASKGLAAADTPLLEKQAPKPNILNEALAKKQARTVSRVTQRKRK